MNEDYHRHHPNPPETHWTQLDGDEEFERDCPADEETLKQIEELSERMVSYYANKEQEQ